LIAAVIKGQSDTIASLVKLGAKVDQAVPVYRTTDKKMLPARTALWQAASQGRVDFVLLLVTNAADPNIAMKKDGTTPLYIAAQNGHQGVVWSLLTNGAFPNQATSTDNGYTPLNAAVNMGHADVVEIILKYGGDPNKIRADDGTSSLFSAAQKSNNEILKLLLHAKSNTNICRNADGTSPLMAASLNGNSEGTRLLIEGGAMVGAVNKKAGANALYSAVANKHGGVARVLLEAKADANFVRPKVGDSVLSRAIVSGEKDMVRLLLSYGADPEKVIRGYSPLLIAVENGHTSIVQVLLAYGANPLRKIETEGSASTPEEVAKAKGLKEVASILSKYAAMPVETRACTAAVQFNFMSKDLSLVVKVVRDGSEGRTYTLDKWMEMSSLADGLTARYPGAGLPEEFTLTCQSASEVAINAIADRVRSARQLEVCTVTYTPHKLTTIVVQPIGFSEELSKEKINLDLTSGTVGYVRRKVARVLKIRKGWNLCLFVQADTKNPADNWNELLPADDNMKLIDMEITEESIERSLPEIETFRCEQEKQSGGCTVC
jgi:ankyrin repeat protein